MGTRKHEPSGTLSARLVRQLAMLARRHGLDDAALCREVGVEPATLDDPEARIPYPQVDALTEAVAARVDDPTLGLELAQVHEPDTYDVTGLVMMASPTLREGYARALRYQQVWGDFERFVMEPCEGGAKIRFSAPGAWRPAHRVLSECALAGVRLGASLVTGTPAVPLWVRFQHEAPPDTSAHEAFFGLPVTFGARATEIAFADATLDLPLTHANEMFLAFFEQQAKAKVERLPSPHRLSEQVLTALRGSLAGGDPSLVAVAAKLHMSPRTLQRRLKEEGTRHEELLDGLRRELARLYLDKRLSIAEVSYLLGYANPTTFHRAFKRWMGESPEQHRGR